MNFAVSVMREKFYSLCVTFIIFIIVICDSLNKNIHLFTTIYLIIY